MKLSSIAILAILVLASCNLGGGGEGGGLRNFEVYISSLETDVFKLSMSSGDWSVFKESLGIKPTGVLTETDEGVLIPSSNVVYEIDGLSSIVFEGDDVFKKVLYNEGTIVALVSDGIVSNSAKVEGNFKDFCVLDGRIFAVSDEGIELVDLENSRSVLVEKGAFTTIECQDPYIYAGYDGGVVEFLVEGDKLSRSADYGTGFGVSSIFASDDGVYAAGDGGIALFTTLGSSYTLFDYQVDDIHVVDDLVFLVSDMRNSFEVLDISDLENPKIVLSESLDVYRPSIVVRGE